MNAGFVTAAARSQLEVRSKVGDQRRVDATAAAPRSSPSRTAASLTDDLCTSNPTTTVLRSSDMVGDLRMWLGQATPGNPRRCAGRRPPSPSARTTRPLHPV